MTAAQVLRAWVVMALLLCSSCTAREPQLPFLGSQKTPLLLELFISPLCGVSRTSVRELLPRIKREYLDSGRATLVVHLLYLQSAEETGILSGIICAGESPQGFYPYLVRLNQLIEDEAEVDPYGIARALEIPMMSFRQCMESERPLQVLEYSRGEAHRRGLEIVPVLMSGDTWLHPLDYNELQRKIAEKVDADPE